MRATDLDALRQQLTAHEGLRLSRHVYRGDVCIEHSNSKYFISRGIAFNQVRPKTNHYNVSRNVAKRWHNAINGRAVWSHLAAIKFQSNAKRRASVRDRHIAQGNGERKAESLCAKSCASEQRFAMECFVPSASAFLYSSLIRALSNPDPSFISIVARSVRCIRAVLATTVMIPTSEELRERLCCSASSAEAAVYA